MIFVLAFPVQYGLGLHFHKNAILALRRRAANMDVLVFFSTNIAFIYSLVLIFFNIFTTSDTESTMAASHFLAMAPILITVMLGGKYAESRARVKTLSALHILSSARPATANLFVNNNIKEISSDLVEIGDTLRIFAGSKIPADGYIIDDQSIVVDESILTGESEGIEKVQGDMLLGGTVCISGSCLMKVTVVGDGTAIGQIVSMVEQTSSTKAGVQRVADKIGRIFVPFVLGISLIVFIVWTFIELFNGSNEPLSMKILFALKFALATMMIACPCAMGLATPTAVSVAIGMAASRYGCLIKSAEAFEIAKGVKCVVFDKTGTVTNGIPNVVGCAIMGSSFQSLPHPNLEANTPSEISLQSQSTTTPVTTHFLDNTHSANLESRFWWLTGSAEANSDHPLAKSIVEHARSVTELSESESFKSTEGRGVAAVVNGVEIFLGNRVQVESSNITLPDNLNEWTLSHEDQACTIIYVHTNDLFIGAIALKDSVQSGAKEVITSLQEQGIHVVLCTGDNDRTARAVANEVGISDVASQQLPQDKVDVVKRCQREFGITIMIGDGINDAPALSQADLGVSIGAGVSLTNDSSDVILVRSRLVDFHTFLALSVATVRCIYRNFIWAFLFNGVCLPIATGMFYPVSIPPLAAGIAMASSSLLVVTSSLMLRRFTPSMSSLSDGRSVFGGIKHGARRVFKKARKLSTSPQVFDARMVELSPIEI